MNIIKEILSGILFGIKGGIFGVEQKLIIESNNVELQQETDQEALYRKGHEYLTTKHW